MNYTVVWTPAAENALTQIWLDSTFRGGVTRASQVVDDRLRQFGPQVGESRPNDRRITFEAPLGVLFRVDEPARVVTVLYVWAFT